MTKCHTLGGLNNTFILHSTEGWEVQDQGGVSSFLVKVLFVACMVGREKALVSFPPLIRAPIPSWGGSTLRTSFKPNDGLKVPPPNTIPVGVRAAAYLCVCVCVWGCTFSPLYSVMCSMTGMKNKWIWWEGWSRWVGLSVSRIGESKGCI